jgi:hypothetical protein
VSEAPEGALPSLAAAAGWRGFELDDADGRPVGRVEGVYADAEGGGPVWLVVALERRGPRRLALGSRAAKVVVAPLRECAAIAGRAWTAQKSEAMLGAPAVDPTRSLLREHEAAICEHYGIGEQVGRHAEVAARPPGAITAQPA